MPKMIDALYPASIPAGTTCDLIAAYIDHNRNPQSFQQAVARFSNAIHLRITAVTCDPAADIIDGEQGTGITPAMAAQWALKKRAKGDPFVIYCNENLPNSWGWAAYEAAVRAVGIDPATVLWWTADYDGVATLRPGEWARQYTDRDQNGNNTYDTSITATSWPPNAPAHPPEDHMVYKLAHDKWGTGYWLGDGISRRPLPDAGNVRADTLDVLKRSGDTVIDLGVVTDLDAIGTDLAARIAGLSSQLAGVLAAVKTGGTNVPALAAELSKTLGADVAAALGAALVKGTHA